MISAGADVMKRLIIGSIVAAMVALMGMALCGVDMIQFGIGFVEGLTGLNVDWLVEAGFIQFWIMYTIIYL